jgi:hypothetical protein
MLAHERDVVRRRPRRAEAGRRLDPIGAGVGRCPAEPDLLRVGQVTILEDDLHLAAARMASPNDRVDLRSHVGVVAAAHRADVDDHVELLGSFVQRSLRFVDLGARGGRPVWEADGRRRAHAAPGKERRGTAEPVRQDAHARHPAAAGQETPLFELGCRQAGIEQCMIDHAGDLVVSGVHPYSSVPRAGTLAPRVAGSGAYCAPFQRAAVPLGR